MAHIAENLIWNYVKDDNNSTGVTELIVLPFMRNVLTKFYVVLFTWSFEPTSKQL